MAVFRAKEPFALPGPIGRVVPAGEVMSDTDPDFKGREHLFEPVEASIATAKARLAGKEVLTGPTSETASAEPNAKRSVSTTPKPGPKPPVEKVAE